MTLDDGKEWLEADGLGGFASGTASGLRTRRYHALLLSASSPPAGRVALVQGLAARLEVAGASEEIWPQAYGGGFRTGVDDARIEFAREPWPRWRFATRFGVALECELFVPRGHAAVVLAFRLDRPSAPARLVVRPLFSCRDFHALHHENPHFGWDATRHGSALVFAPYGGMPAVSSLSNATYRSAPDWYRGFWYEAEAERGLDAVEDLASPGELLFELGKGEGLWVLSAQVPGGPPVDAAEGALPALVERLRRGERERRAAFARPLERAAADYAVRRGAGRTLIAGYPWFGDWGRDTFIALRGLCLAGGDTDTARTVLCAWASFVSEGMLPNHFPDRADDEPRYNSVDASLWFVLAADELCRHPDARLSASDRLALERAMLDIVGGYARGTRYGIRRDADGLLAAGVPGVQLTWMDARVGERVITPRIGKPVEIQALWVHALFAAAERAPHFLIWAEQARVELERRFWNAERSMLFDVVDEDHVPGRFDAACRPNQIFAAGGLPFALLAPERCRLVVDAVERELWTPLGLRSLECGHPAYAGRYAGGPSERDAAYHQGTVWPWLLGPFVEAWVKCRGASPDVKAEARSRFLAPLRRHLEEAGLGHVSEIADGDPPHTPRGCPFQAWSLGELLRLERVVLG